MNLHLTPMFLMRSGTRLANSPMLCMTCVLSLSWFLAGPATAQEKQLPPAAELKKLSVEELMDIEVTSVSKRAEKLATVASAIQVITQVDIQRSGATSLPEALRLAPNLQVAQLNASAWIISARGFNATFSNKLLVLIDGRTVYSPLFAGVFWDVQSVLLEDIERIEVISGPGATLWGANAVNGVINITTKNASDTQGLYVSAGAGTFLRRQAAARYGGRISPELSYRVYAQHADRDHTYLSNGTAHTDEWDLTHSGFSMNWDPSSSDAVRIQGNVYWGTHQTAPAESTVDGQNILGRWSHSFSEKSDIKVQAYYDRTWRRDAPSTITDGLQTYDVDFQHRVDVLKHQRIVWGANYRFMRNETQHLTEVVALLPPERNMKLFSGFIQDEISLLSERLRIIAGTKFHHHYFSGFELQPGARVAWSGQRSTTWAAVSRALRAPSRIDVDYFIPAYEVPPTSPSVAGGPNFRSEKVTAWEVGYRMQPMPDLSLAVSGFYNRYDDLYSVEALPNTLTYQVQNGSQGESRGVEFSGRYRMSDQWHVRGGFTHFHKHLENRPGHVFDVSLLGNDPENQYRLQSMLDLPLNFQLDIALRYVEKLPKPFIPDYFTFDARIAWMFQAWEVAVVGQNLWEDRHREFLFEIPRSFYAKIACRF